MALTGKMYLVTTLDTKWEEIVYIKKLLNLKNLTVKLSIFLHNIINLIT